MAESQRRVIMPGADVHRANRGLELVREMAERFNEILAGSAEEADASAFLLEKMRGIGLDVEEHTPPAIVSHPGDGCLEVLLDNASESIPCSVFAQSEPTPPGGIEASVVYVGAGGLEDYAEDAVVGKIVLAELSYSPPRPEKARIAKSRGAAALVLINWGSDERHVLPLGTVKCVWGNPTRRDIDAITTLPAIGISRAAGVRLKEVALAGGEARARVRTEVDRAWRNVHLPIGWLTARDRRSDEFLLVGGHYDSWGGGVTDNFTGNIGALLVAERLADRRRQLHRDVAFAFWPAHETGIMCGSTWFADRFWDDLRDRCVGYLIMDSLGMIGTSVWDVRHAAEFTRLVADVAECRSERSLQFAGRPAKTGDQSFFGLGIPSLEGRSVVTPEKVAEEHGAFLGWWYHSEDDTLDKIDPDAFAFDVDVFTDYALRIAGEAVLPYEGASVATEIITRLDTLGSQLAARGFDPDAAGLSWTALREEAEALRSVCAALDQRIEEVRAAVGAQETAEQVATANKWLRDLSRHTSSVRYAAVHRHDQDNYGVSSLRYTLPELSTVVDLAEADGEQRHLIWGEAARARNRLFDALRDARRSGEDALTRIQPA